MAKNDHLNKLLRQEEDLPDYLKWNNVENNIQSRLQQLDARTEEDEDSDNRIIVFLIPFLLVAGILLCAIWYRQINDKDGPAQVSNAISRDQGVADYKHNQISESDATESTYVFNYSEYVKDYNESKSVISYTDTETDTKQSLSDIANESLYSKAITSINAKSYHASDNERKGSRTDVNNENKRAEKTLDSANNNLINQVARIERNNISVIGAGYDFTDYLTLGTIALSPQPAEVGSGIALTLSADMNYIQPQINSINTDRKSISHTGQINYGATASIIYNLNDNWSVTAGISVQDYVSRFDYQNQWDTDGSYVRTVPGRNIYTGEVLQFLREGKLVTMTKRNLIHYNKYRSVSIPLAISRNLTTGKYRLSAGVGVRYNLILDAQGKFNSAAGMDSLEDVFELESVDYLDHSGSLDPMASLHVNRRLGSKMFIGLGINATFSSANWTNDPSQEMRPTLWQSSVVLGYRL